MSDNTNEGTTVVGAVDGPRAKILEAIRRDVGLTMGNVGEIFNLKTLEENIEFQVAIDDLIEAGEIYSQKGRSGGLKLGPKPASNPQSLATQARAMVLKAKKDAQEKARKQLAQESDKNPQ